MKGLRLLALVAVFFVFAIPLAAETKYDTLDLRLDSNEVSGINNLGQVVGVYFDASGQEHAFCTKPNSPMNPKTDDLGIIVRRYSKAFGINDLGQVVGVFADASGQEHAFCTKPNSPIDPKTDDLGSLGGKGVCANGINNHGQVVGFSFTSLGGPAHPFCTRPNSPIDPKTDDLGLLGAKGEAVAINDNGQVVGYFSKTWSPLNGITGQAVVYNRLPSHAFRTAANKPINPAIDDLSPSLDRTSYAQDVNDLGQVVGVYFDASYQQHAFCTKPNSPIDPKTDDLGSLGGKEACARAINNRGQAVGSSKLPNGNSHAFLYSNGKMQDLNDLIPASPGRVLYAAKCINDKGQIVALAKGYVLLLTPVNMVITERKNHKTPPPTGFLHKWNANTSKWIPIKSWTESGLNLKQPTAVLVHGWGGRVSNKSIHKIASSLYGQNQNANILGWDWSAVAMVKLPNHTPMTGILDIPGILLDIRQEGLKGAAKCIEASKTQGIALAYELKTLKIDPGNLQLVGHSAGAAVIGETASNLFKLTRKKVKRLTMLDAPCLVLKEIPLANLKFFTDVFTDDLLSIVVNAALQTHTLNAQQTNVFVSTNNLLLTRADALAHIYPWTAFQVENYYSGPPGDSGRKAFGFGAPIIQSGVNNVFNGQIAAGEEILNSTNVNLDHFRILDWYIKTPKSATEQNQFPAGISWSILSPMTKSFRAGCYSEIKRDTKIFSAKTLAP